AADFDKPLRLGIRHWTKHHRVHDSEHKRIDPDSECERQQGHTSHTRVTEKCAECISKVLPEVVDRIPSPGSARVLRSQCEVSEFVMFRHSPQGLEFLLHLPLLVPAVRWDQVFQPAPEHYFAPRGSGPITRDMAAANSLHSECCCDSCFRPVAVRR